MEGILHMEVILDTKNQDAEGTCTMTVTIPMRAMAVIDMVVLGDDTAMDQEDVVSDISVGCFRVQCWIDTSSSIVPTVVMPQYKIVVAVSFFMYPTHSHQAPWHERRSTGYASISHQSGKDGPTIDEVIRYKREQIPPGRAKRGQKCQIVESVI